MSRITESPSAARIESVFRESHGQAVATLIRMFGDISLAEDAVQDAFTVALTRWPRDGVPANPAGWMITTARNRAIDVLRRSRRGMDLYEEWAVIHPDEREPTGDVHGVGPNDDQLRLIFTCCHPALRQEHRVALTLRLLGGLTVDEVARSFLVSEAAMAKRLVRAKHKIKMARIPYRVPDASEIPARLSSVLAVLYLIYNTGADDPGRRSLREDAIRMTRALAALLPEEPEAAGLLALILLNESRMPSRFDQDELVLLRDQDRERWDHALIQEGQSIVRSCITRSEPGPYQLQAAIQAVHCDAASFEETDWAQVVELYDHLYTFLPTPVVALNRAIAVGETKGPEAELDELSAIEAELGDYHLFHAARANALRRIGRLDAARAAFQRASALAPSAIERRFLTEQIALLSR